MLHGANMRDVLAACDVHRWHIINTTRQQTLAEHMWAVAILSSRICAELNQENELVNEFLVVEMALIHDLHEVHDGDPPASQRDARTQASRIDSMPLAEGVVKMADWMEAAWFIRNNHNPNNIRSRIRAGHCEKFFVDVLARIKQPLSRAVGKVWAELDM